MVRNVWQAGKAVGQGGREEEGQRQRKVVGQIERLSPEGEGETKEAIEQPQEIDISARTKFLNLFKNALNKIDTDVIKSCTKELPIWFQL